MTNEHATSNLMKTQFRQAFLALTLSALATICSLTSSAWAQGTVFTYQGRLNDGGVPANGTYDLVFTVYASANGVNDGFANQTNPATGITNGLFTVALDLGLPGIFTGPDRWLEIAARSNGVGAYITLTPRQKITATPYAITAGNLTGVVPSSGVAGTYSSPVTFNSPANSFTGNGGGLTNVNAFTLNGYSYCNLPCYWNLTGNAGTSPGLDFLGTSDNQPLLLKVNNTSALEIMPGTSLPNFVGGIGAFRPTVLGAGVSGVVVAGGNAPSGAFTGGGGGDFMAAYDDDCVVGGGFGNKAGSNNGDPTDAAFATIGGGIFNVSSNFASTVGGGAANTAGGTRAVVAGGNGNQALGDYSFIGGGFSNTNSGNYGAVAGGYQNLNIGLDATIGGGYDNFCSNSYATVSGGYGNYALGSESAIGGGGGNTAIGNSAVVGGGVFNRATGDYAFAGGGWGNDPDGYASVVSGGLDNGANGAYATVPGGFNNSAAGQYSFAAGQQAQALHQGCFVWADSQNSKMNSTTNDQFSIRAQGGVLLSTNTSLNFGNAGTSMLWPDQGGAIELGNSLGSGSTPYLDFHYGTGSSQDFNIRLINNGNQQLSFYRSGSGTALAVMNAAGLTVNGTFVSASDRNVKENFQPVSTREILEKVAALPLTRWNYKEDKTQEHIGPMAQDFYSAFAVGPDERHITTIDESGVALAAIQGLNQKLLAQEAAMKTKDQEIQELRLALAELQKTVRKIDGKTQE
jgi:hypothetical protein